MKTQRIRGGPHRQSFIRRAKAPVHLIAIFCVALGVAAALGGAWLIWQAPHCRQVAAHAHYTPLASAQCERHAPTRGAMRAP
jgi:hypothetical protein